MIKKESFVQIVDGLQTYWDKLNEFEGILGVYITEGFLVNIVDDIIEFVSKNAEEGLDTEEFGSWLSYYVFELDFGRADIAANCVEIDGAKYSLNTAEKLYDVITLLQGKEVKAEEKHYCACEQLRWERDIAMQQLQDHGIPFGGIADDVVKVVRCEDCQLFKTFEELMDDPDGLYDDYPIAVGMDLGFAGLCCNVDKWTCLHDYCSYGERKDG